MPIGKADLLLNDIDTGHHFGDRVLHLDAGVHFHEEEVVILVEHELDGADVPIMYCFDDFDGNAADFPAEFLVDGGRRCFLEQLLMPALDRAVALAEMSDMPAMVGGNLYLNMAGLKKISFEVNGIVAERGLRLRLRGLKRASEVFRFIDDAHAASSPTG